MNKKNVRYYDWQKLPTILKRFCFEDKLRFCADYASRVCTEWRYDHSRADKKALPFPWELNVIAMLAIVGEEYDRQKVERNIFHRFVNTVRMAIPFDKGDNFESVMSHYFMATQSFYQQNTRIILSRFFYIFTHSSMRLDEHIKEELGVSYRNIMMFALFVLSLENENIPVHNVLNSILSSDKNVEMRKIIEEIPQVLSLDRLSFMQKQKDKIERSPRGYLLAENILEQYPILRYKSNLFLPLPYLLKNAVTIGLLHRITTGKNLCRREKIGKVILEEYVYEIMKHSGCYDIVLREIMYSRHGKNSPDVIAIKDDKCVLLEVKFKQPTLKLRTLNPNDETQLDSACVEAIGQVYRGIKDREKYIKDKVFKDENMFGLVVLFEESNLSREKIFSMLQDKNPDWDADIIQYIIRHIRIVSLYDVEILCFKHYDLIGMLRYYQNAEKNEIYDRRFLPNDKVFDETELDLPYWSKLIEYTVD